MQNWSCYIFLFDTAHLHEATLYFYVFRENVVRPQANPTRCLWSRINCTNFAFCEGCASHWQIEGWHLSVPVMFLAKLLKRLKSSSLDPCVSEWGTENCIILNNITFPYISQVQVCTILCSSWASNWRSGGERGSALRSIHVCWSKIVHLETAFVLEIKCYSAFSIFL